MPAFPESDRSLKRPPRSTLCSGALSRFYCFEKRIEVILLGKPVALSMCARSALMRHYPLPFLVFDHCRAHHTAAGRRSVARGYIDVLAPEALRAMVGKTAALHRGSAALAVKIFHHFLEHAMSLPGLLLTFKPRKPIALSSPCLKKLRVQ